MAPFALSLFLLVSVVSGEYEYRYAGRELQSNFYYQRVYEPQPEFKYTDYSNAYNLYYYYYDYGYYGYDCYDTCHLKWVIIYVILIPVLVFVTCVTCSVMGCIIAKYRWPNRNS